ncbi:MAG: nicotinate (nicotinamide) nucleotide adenylyltransferase [Burkholderiaceae bacterium]
MSGTGAAPLRLGVFGGAFDPPHLAHRALVQAALDQLRLDRLLVFPTGQAWHKARQLSPAADRVAMAKLAFDGMARVQVDARETHRSGPSYTVETLRELLAEHPGAQVFLLIGQDQAKVFHTWHAWEELLRLATIAVAARKVSTGIDEPFVPPVEHSSRFVQLDFARIAMSATQIRQCARAGENLVALVGEPVARYIAYHHLYQTT